MHLVFFLGTWGATIAFVWLTPTADGRFPVLRALAMLVIGFGLLECDLRILKELYQPLHVWWVVWGSFAIFVGSVGLLRSLAFKEFEPGRVFAISATASALVAVIVAALTAQSVVQHLAARAELAKHTLGQAAVSMTAVTDPLDDLDLGKGPAPKAQPQAEGPAVSYARPLNFVLISVDALQ